MANNARFLEILGELKEQFENLRRPLNIMTIGISTNRLKYRLIFRILRIAFLVPYSKDFGGFTRF